MNKTKVIGLGNDILTDDGIGTRIVHDLQEFFQYSGIDYYTTPEGSLDLLEEIQGYDNLIVIDAIVTNNNNPGDVCIMSFPLEEHTLHLSGLHDVNFNDMIKLSQELNIRVPENISVLSVEILEDKVFSKEFSDVLQRKYPNIIDFVRSYVRDFIRGDQPERIIEKVENGII